MHCISLPKFCISIIFNFSWEGCNAQEKWKTKVMQNFGGQIRCIMGVCKWRIVWDCACMINVGAACAKLLPICCKYCFVWGFIVKSGFNRLAFNFAGLIKGRDDGHENVPSVANLSVRNKFRMKAKTSSPCVYVSSESPCRLNKFVIVICLPTEYLGVSWELVKTWPCVTRSNLNLELLVFKERGKPEYPEKNLSQQGKEPTANSIHIWHRRQDFQPAPHWWEASDLTAARPLLAWIHWVQEYFFSFLISDSSQRLGSFTIHPQYFENGPLEWGYRLNRTWF